MQAEEKKSTENELKVALHYVAEKAGMNNNDKAKIQEIITQASKDSDYYKREQLRSAQATERAKAMAAKIESFKQLNGGRLYETAVKDMNSIHSALESEDRILDRTWMHIDMDMFYAAVEIRDRPELATIPIAIGSESMISTANYEARKYGVRSAMPGFIAKKLCPQLTFIPCNFNKYREVSYVFKEIVE